MSTFTLTINTDNDAFAEGGEGYEVARILRHVAEDVTDGRMADLIRDANGNTVGHYAFTS